MKPVLGISAFGLKDSVAKIGESCHELGFYLVDALLPMSPFGRIRTGDEAKNDQATPYAVEMHFYLLWQSCSLEAMFS